MPKADPRHLLYRQYITACLQLANGRGGGGFYSSSRKTRKVFIQCVSYIFSVSDYCVESLPTCVHNHKWLSQTPRVFHMQVGEATRNVITELVFRRRPAALEAAQAWREELGHPLAVSPRATSPHPHTRGRKGSLGNGQSPRGQVRCLAGYPSISNKRLHLARRDGNL